MTKTTTFTDAAGWTATVETRNVLGEQVLKMCADLDDVQRCASMGDFRIVEISPPVLHIGAE